MLTVIILNIMCSLFEMEGGLMKECFAKYKLN